MTTMDDRKDPLPTLRIVWMAMLGAVLLYGGAAVWAGRDRPDNPELVLWVGIFLAVTAGILVITALLVRPVIAGVSPTYTTFCVIRWSLLETIAIFGLVLKILGASWMWAGGFLLVSLVTLAIVPPTEGERGDFADWR